MLSLKEPLFARLRKDVTEARQLADEMWIATLLLDELALFTTESYQKAREEVISRQQRELLELSTPVVKLWDDILALPLIGTLDSGRTQVVMESLLQKIVETGASIAIIDITGVPTVDTLVAQHLMKTVAAARLMGADCIISGIRPQIAQTIVHLGVDLSAVTTKASLADAFRVALKRTGASVTKLQKAQAEPDGRAHGDSGRLTRWNASRSCAWAASCWSPSRWTCTTSSRCSSRTTSPRASCATAPPGVLIDISSLDVVDSFIGRMISNIAAHVARAGCADRGGRHAARRGHHAGGARPVARGRAHRLERREGHGAAAGGRGMSCRPRPAH